MMPLPLFDFMPDTYADDLSWDTPPVPHKYALEIITGKSVVLVRHLFAEAGNVDEIYSNYLDDKIRENTI